MYTVLTFLAHQYYPFHYADEVFHCSVIKSSLRQEICDVAEMGEVLLEMCHVNDVMN
jgi:hypothetical protein